MLNNFNFKNSVIQWKEFLYFLEYRFSSLFNKRKKIAVIKQGGLGDYIIFTAFLQNLRKVEPEAHITLFAGFYCADVWKDNPNIDRLTPVLSGQSLYSQGMLDLDRFLHPLQGVDKYFDVVYDPNHCIDYYFNGIIVSNLIAKEKIAYKREVSIYADYEPNEYYSKLIDRPILKNIAQYNSYFLDSLYPGNRFDPYDTELCAQQSDKSTLSRNSNRTIGIHPTSSNSARHLTKDKIIEIINSVISFGFEPLIIGSDVWDLKREFPIFFDDLTVGETFHLVSQLSGVICTDSGIKQIAGHYKIPTIEISHIPEKFDYLNGPFISGDKLFANVSYWRPRPGQYFYKVIKPQNIETIDEINSGKAINSFDRADLLDALHLMTQSCNSIPQK